MTLNQLIKRTWTICLLVCAAVNTSAWLYVSVCMMKINGWYSNPYDKRLFVQDRMCGMNYSMNMAKNSAKIFTAVISAVLIGCVIWVVAILVEFATTEVTVCMAGGKMDIRAASYDCQIQSEQILSVKLLDEMPEDNFYRSNGGDTEKFLIGHFRGKETGKCMMFYIRKKLRL